MKNATGFTLIELMITVSIVGILAAIAIPAYHSYIVKSQVTEGLSLAGSYQTNIAEYYNENAAWPTDGTTFGNTTSSGTYVTSVTITNSMIIIVYGNTAAPQLQGTILALAPGATADGTIVWQCGISATVPSAVMAGSASLLTTVPPQVLPASCR